jgi:hypothetical protein
MSQNPQSPATELTDIFINYRRADTSGHAGRLEQELSRRFPGRVFMDIHTIEVGTDFADAINSEVGKCGALIVLIGNQWLDITDPKTGKRRLDNPNDFVALEIAEALKRNTRVIPVLVEGAKMPEAEELPAPLAALVRRNAFEITDTRWDYDVAQLIKVLEKICGVSTPLAKTRTGTGDGTTTGTGTGDGIAGRWGIARIAIISAVAALLVIAALIIYSRTGKTTPQTAAVPAQSPARPAATDTGANANASKQPEVASDAQGQAVVRLSGSEAQFIFPFDPSGRDWRWGLEDTRVDAEEYRWDIIVDDGAKKYDIEFWERKTADDEPKKGLLEDVLIEAEPGVWWLAIGNGAWEEQPRMAFKHTVIPNGLKITVAGKGIQTIFANHPEKVSLRMKTPKMKETEVFPPVRIEYE